jgi:hypothetical protein
MNTRQARSRKVFRLESLEVRNAPSHFGVAGHVALALHAHHAAAEVSRFHDSRSTDRTESREKNSGADRSNDSSGLEKNSTDPSSPDPSSSTDLNSNSVDLQGNR